MGETLPVSRPVTRTIAYRVLAGCSIPADGAAPVDPPPPTDEAIQGEEE